MKRVFVFGAGFTKSFCPNAPLMVGDFGAEDLIKKFREFEASRRLIEEEMKRGSGRINIERLMTRLDTLMPYDSGHIDEYKLLLSQLKIVLTRRIKDALGTDFLTEALGEKNAHKPLLKFAERCITKRIDCITFNYDELLDSALYNVPFAPGNAWNPNSGYGFSAGPLKW
jgi:hypothetical protein